MLSTIEHWHLIETLTRTLELCGMDRGRSCVVVHDGAAPRSTIDAVTVAAHRSGAVTTVVTVPDDDPGADPFGSAPVMAACVAADLVVDLTPGGPDPGGGLAEVTSGGGRVLGIGASAAEDLVDFVTHPGTGRRVRETVSSLRDAAMLVVVTAGDNALEVPLADAVVEGAWGVADEAGSRAVWPGGTVSVVPPPETAGGVVAPMAGDVVVPPGRHVVAPAALVVEAGHVSDVSGGDDAALLRAVFEAGSGSGARVDAPAGGDHGSYRLSWIRWGMNPTAPHEAGVVFDPDLLVPRVAGVRAGVVGLGFGPAARPSVELVLRAATVAVDDVVVIDSGHLVGALEPDVYERASRRGG